MVNDCPSVVVSVMLCIIMCLLIPGVWLLGDEVNVASTCGAYEIPVLQVPLQLDESTTVTAVVLLGSHVVPPMTRVNDYAHD